MGNVFAEKPALEPIVLPSVWTCPITGLVVPKDPDKNLAWRADLLTAADADRELQVDLFTACSQSELFFINAFCFTLRIFEPGADGRPQQAENTHLPFVTWPIQDAHILRIAHGIDEGESLLTDKSRDMGATWDHLAVYVHRFLFREDESHLMISRKEDAVDVLDGPPKNYPFGSLADPGTLFGKIDYILSRLPEWMLPRMVRKKMHLVNLDTRTRIDGESSNATAGSSDRRTSIFLDEMAKMKEAEAIKRSTKDVTACRLVCSTPNGPGTTYSKWRMSGQIDVMVLPWWEHPEKGRDRYAKQDELGRWQIRSPFYDLECETRSPKEVAIELDMDHVGSGDTFFEAAIIEQHKKLHGRKAKRHQHITFRPKTTDEKVHEAIRKMDIKAIHYNGAAGPWRIWCDLTKGRPDQTRTYTIGIDISKGQGASNSTMSVTCNETREKIAEFADANTPPYELARLAVAAAIWCGGRNRRPLVIWENNGDPGFDFGRQLVHIYHYPSIYFDRATGTVREKSGKRYGWRSNPEKKAAALGLLRRAYAHGRFLNHSLEALTECLTYISYDGGGIGPAELVEESESARKAHGDRVIADMLCLVGMKDNKLVREEYSGPERSIGYRLKQFRDAKKAKKGSAKRFNFETEAA
jgi:hypothetical protein